MLAMNSFAEHGQGWVLDAGHRILDEPLLVFFLLVHGGAMAVDDGMTRRAIRTFRKPSTCGLEEPVPNTGP